MSVEGREICARYIRNLRVLSKGRVLLFGLIQMIFRAFSSVLAKAKIFSLASNDNQAPHLVSDYDLLTGAMNRRVCFESLRNAVNSAQENNSNLALLYVDIDNLKHFCCHNGHLAGDELLKRFVVLVEPLLEEPRTLFRFGGEEFIILLSGFDRKNAWGLSQKIRDICREALAPSQPQDCGDEHCMGPADVSVSIGISLFEQDINVEGLIQQAEDNMHNAKLAGKDRVWI